MKKSLLTLLLACTICTVNAALTFTINDDLIDTPITKDTSIIVTDYEEDFFTGDIVMGVKGNLYSSESMVIKVTIQRSKEGVVDEFCSGQCRNGNGLLTQEIEVDALMPNNSYYAHFYPQAAGNTTISYTIDDGHNPAITLTVTYSYLTSDVEAVEVPTQTTEVIYNVLGKRMPTNNINELPAGIYIINGKKYIKQQ